MSIFNISFWLIALLPLRAAARNCTYTFAKNEVVEWQPGACYRGTWNIISTCTTTIIACTWSIQHLNVPAREDSTVTQMRRKVKWMVITVLFPEWILIHAIFQFYTAFKALAAMEREGKAVEWPWWYRSPPLSWLPRSRDHLPSKDAEKQKVKSDDRKWTLTHCYFANMGGFIVVTPWKDENGQPVDGPKLSYPITANQLARSSYTYPPIVVEEIKDKSKQNWLGKLLAAVQILQLILSVITRHIQHAAFSQLETVTLTFAQGVASNNQAAESAQTSLEFEKHWDSLVSLLLNRPSYAGSDIWRKPASRIPNDNIPIYDKQNDIHPAMYLLALASALFGGMHAIAWNFEFPTAVEKLMWRVATTVSAGSPVVGLLVVPLAQFTRSSGDPRAFMKKCIILLRAFSLSASLDFPIAIAQAIQILEEGLRAAEPQRYQNAFPIKNWRDIQFLVSLRSFLSVPHEQMYAIPYDFDLHEDKEFVRNFRRLFNVLLGGDTKQLQSAAVTNKWPRKPVLPHEVNLGIFYITSLLYCASRLLLLGIAVSSIRKMPASVYEETDWTKYVPKFGANGG
ncbi:hypothetical protein LLEC1_03599 [Akanthomyces lecanii]|uniref:Uncharacterized protein n=1 Tax=Cordyceps confragosa TaxID=2714763 RepID=A0A179I1U5_CORDF|nr:hypothetical protein LLEC1_03599 [Akanthomyces lecanii]